MIRELAAKQPYDDQALYLQVTRGVAKRDHAFPQGVAPTVFMMSNPLPLPSREQVDKGVAVVTADDNRWHRCDLKTTSLLGNVLMRQLAVDGNAVETVMFRDGFLTEASASNVLIVKAGTVVAPPKDNLILPGITYDATLEVARDAGVPLEVRKVTRAEALSADEMWLSSSTKEVLAITRVDGVPFSAGTPGPVFRKVWQAFQASKPRAAVPASTYFSPESGATWPNAPWWNTRPLPRARSTVTTSPMNTTWSPAKCRAWWWHSSHATQPSISGASDHPRRCATPAKRSACGREKRRASSACSAASTFTA